METSTMDSFPLEADGDANAQEGPAPRHFLGKRAISTSLSSSSFFSKHSEFSSTEESEDLAAAYVHRVYAATSAIVPVPHRDSVSAKSPIVSTLRMSDYSETSESGDDSEGQGAGGAAALLVGPPIVAPVLYDLEKTTDTSLARGLTLDAARRRLKRDGQNKRKRTWRERTVMKYEESKARAKYHHEQMGAQCLREGVYMKVPATQLVVGDVVALCAGDVAPADIHLFENYALRSNSIFLTGVEVVGRCSVVGQRLPSENDENVGRLGQAIHPRAYRRSYEVLSGSVIASGRGTGVVIRTGHNTTQSMAVPDRSTIRPPVRRLAVNPKRVPGELSLLSRVRRHLGVYPRRFHDLMYFATMRYLMLDMDGLLAEGRPTLERLVYDNDLSVVAPEVRRALASWSEPGMMEENSTALEREEVLDSKPSVRNALRSDDDAPCDGCAHTKGKERLRSSEEVQPTSEDEFCCGRSTGSAPLADHTFGLDVDATTRRAFHPYLAELCSVGPSHLQSRHGGTYRATLDRLVLLMCLCEANAAYLFRHSLARQWGSYCRKMVGPDVLKNILRLYPRAYEAGPRTSRVCSGSYGLSVHYLPPADAEQWLGSVDGPSEDRRCFWQDEKHKDRFELELEKILADVSSPSARSEHFSQQTQSSSVVPNEDNDSWVGLGERAGATSGKDGSASAEDGSIEDRSISGVSERPARCSSKGGSLSEPASSEGERMPERLIRPPSTDLLLVAVGSPEVLLARCDHIVIQGVPQVLTDAMRENVRASVTGQASSRHEVIGFAQAVFSAHELTGKLRQTLWCNGDWVFDDSPEADRMFIKRKLAWVGYACVKDRLNDRANVALKRFDEAGVNLVLFSNGHPAAVEATLKNLGVLTSDVDQQGCVLDSHEFARKSSLEREKILKGAGPLVFARCSNMVIMSFLASNLSRVCAVSDRSDAATLFRAARVGVTYGRHAQAAPRRAARLYIRGLDPGQLFELYTMVRHSHPYALHTKQMDGGRKRCVLS